MRENTTWVHIPVIFPASKNTITFCKAVVTATAQATLTGPYRCVAKMATTKETG